MNKTPVAAKYRIETTMGAGWQSWCTVDTAADAADRVATARRTGYRARIIDSRGEELRVFFDRTGAARLVTIP